MKKFSIILVFVLLLLVGCAAAEEQQPAQTEQTEISVQTPASGEEEMPELPYQLGDKIEDFTVETIDGESITLSEVLKEKDMVLINLWATWCDSCCYELPLMEEAYHQYQDQVEILALSIEPEDTLEQLKVFAESGNLSFKIAQDTPNLYDKFGFYAIPATIVVDRFGNICFIGDIISDTEEFARLFDAFVGEDYPQSLFLTAVPPKKPHMEPSSKEDLAAALEATAANSADEYVWPMLVCEKDGRSVVASSNAGVDKTTAAVAIKVDAKAGDAIAVTYKTSTEESADVLYFFVNREQVKLFSGEHDWSTYAYPVEQDGTYEVILTYRKDDYSEAGEDTVWVDSVKVLTGQEAADALAANPVYPTGDAVSMMPVDCQARELVFEDSDGTLAYVFTNAKYYLVDTDMVTIHATLTPDVDPEGAFFVQMFKNSYYGLRSCMTEDGYTLTEEVLSIPESVIPFTAVMLGLDPMNSDVRTMVVFRDEANIEQFLKDFQLTGWSYADEADQSAPVKSGEVTYTIRCTDQNGAPVKGVKVQVCDDSSCRVVETDADGVYVLTSEPCPWEIHVLAAPDGYTAAEKEPVITGLAGGEVILTLHKD